MEKKNKKEEKKKRNEKGKQRPSTCTPSQPGAQRIKKE